MVPVIVGRVHVVDANNGLPLDILPVLGSEVDKRRRQVHSGLPVPRIDDVPDLNPVAQRDGRIGHRHVEQVGLGEQFERRNERVALDLGPDACADFVKLDRIVGGIRNHDHVAFRDALPYYRVSRRHGNFIERATEGNPGEIVIHLDNLVRAGRKFHIANHAPFKVHLVPKRGPMDLVGEHDGQVPVGIE